MKPRQLGRVLMAAAFLLHVMVVLQQGQIFLTEEGVVRAVLDSDGSVTEKGNLRVHQVTSPDTMVVATTAGGGDDGRVRLVWCTVLRGEAREDRVRKYEGILKEVESGDRYFVRFLKVCRALRGPLAPEYDDVDPTPGVLGWGWWWMCDLFRTILRAVQDFCTWMVDIVTSAGLGPTLDPLDDLPVNDSSPKLTYARVAGQDRVFGRTKAIATGLKSCYVQLDRCEHRIGPGETQDGLSNDGDRELMNCGCMAKFSSCIQKLNLPLSEEARQRWHRPEPKCYHHDLDHVCTVNLGPFCAHWELKPIAKEHVFASDGR
ncbi:Hypp379 [Branchiostoma lanceolatum]|uniref:Hypp379 protein n=1 Tax=Branchiostoma lanceolatum TaxID=7740 RepID=A0A8J9VAD9_BRALA|nr:Hypp379 [Branchiostoma lanceolatum]